MSKAKEMINNLLRVLFAANALVALILFYLVAFYSATIQKDINYKWAVYLCISLLISGIWHLFDKKKKRR